MAKAQRPHGGLVTEVGDQSYVGTALTMQQAVGFPVPWPPSG